MSLFLSNLCTTQRDVLGAVAVAVTAAVLSIDPAQAGQPPPALDQVSHQFDDAQFRQDKEAIGALLAPDMVYISGGGRLGGATEFLGAFSEPDVKFDPFEIIGRRVVMLGKDVGTVTAEGKIHGTQKGEPFHEHFRYSDTFSYRNGRWQVVYVQVTKLPD